MKTVYIDIEKNCALLWRACYNLEPSVFDIPMPNIKLDTKDDTFNKPIEEITSLTAARMCTTFYVKENEFIEPTNNTLNIYPNHINFIIKANWDNCLDKTGIHMLLDHTIVHEFIHYIRNVRSYQQGHRESVYSYQKYIDEMGNFIDECETESTALILFAKLYGIYSYFMPVYNGLYAKLREKSEPGYIYRLSILNYFQSEFSLYKARYKNQEKIVEKGTKESVNILRYHKLINGNNKHKIELV